MPIDWASLSALHQSREITTATVIGVQQHHGTTFGLDITVNGTPGFLPSCELEGLNVEEAVARGEIQVIVTGVNPEARKGSLVVSQKQVQRRLAKTALIGTIQPGDKVQAVVEKINPSGIEVSVGPSSTEHPNTRIRGFIPNSHLGARRGANALKRGETFEAIVHEVQSNRLSLVLTLKVDPAKFLATLQEGQVITGVIRHQKEFGYFVTLGDGAMDGLLHISEVDGQEVKLGQELCVRVKSIKKELGRVSLSLRQPGAFNTAPADNDAGGKTAATTDADEKRPRQSAQKRSQKAIDEPRRRFSAEPRRRFSAEPRRSEKGYSRGHGSGPSAADRGALAQYNATRDSDENVVDGKLVTAIGALWPTAA